MARIPFFVSTWQRKLRLSGIVLGSYLAIRLIAMLSNKLVGLGWSDIPVSLIVLIYLAFLYIEVWVVLERHTRSAMSILAALFLAVLCITSPMIAFDPVATGSIPDRMRFWEPTLGVEQPPAQRIAYLEASFLDAKLSEAREALDRSRADLLVDLGLLPGSDEIREPERGEVLAGLRRLAEQSDLPAVRARLFAAASISFLARARTKQTAKLLQERAGCVARALADQDAQDPQDAIKEQDGGDRAGAHGDTPGPPPPDCGALARVMLSLDVDSIDSETLSEIGATPSFLDAVQELVEEWIEAAHAGDATADGPVLQLRIGPRDAPGTSFSEALQKLKTTGQQAPLPPTMWRDLQARVERYSSSLGRYLHEREQLDLLVAQLSLIPVQITRALEARTLAGQPPRAEWSVVRAPELQQRLQGMDMEKLTRWLNTRPADVLSYADGLSDPGEREVFYHYFSQTQHWHLRDPEKVHARLERGEDEFRPARSLGVMDLPPVKLCQAMAEQRLDALVLQLASQERSGPPRLYLALVFRRPCSVAWDHVVPIYAQADLLGSTEKDGLALSKASASFFGPYPLGTDFLGRDMLIRLVKGTEGFFLPGLLAMAIGMGLGVLLGALAGYMGGRIDETITFFTTIVGSFPRLVFILLACTIPEDPSMLLIGGITGALFIPQISEAVRRRVLALKAEDFILASRAHGLSLPRILFYHIVWLQCFPEVVRQGLYLFVYIIFLETALSYLEGPGAPPEIPSWGRMLADATAAMFRGQYWHALVPTAAIVFTTLGVASLGEVIVGQSKEERL